MICVRGTFLRRFGALRVRHKFLSGALSFRYFSSTHPDAPSLSYFMAKARRERPAKISPAFSATSEYLDPDDISGRGLKVHFITYGCQMNVNDVEVVRSILLASGFAECEQRAEADVVLLMTCSIREGAETKVWNELKTISRTRKKIVGVLGCMAERVRHRLLSECGLVDVVAGPDSYRDLPRLLAIALHGTQAINVQLSLEETYADVVPVRKDPGSRTAFVSVMRGCDNMCAFCVVPFTRGRERSRPVDTVVEEVKRLSLEGVKEVVLLGQNVNSYRDTSEITHPSTSLDEVQTAPGFRTVYRPKRGGRTFVALLDAVSRVDPEMRIRFTSPHPKDFPLQVIELIKERDNICKQIHLPAQSGSSAVLERMGRGYSAESYLALVRRIRDVIPDVSLTSDFIAGFCGETDEDHQQTLEFIRAVQYSFCFVFPYSMREQTRAFHRLKDDVPADVKRHRHEELVSVFRETSASFNKTLIGSVQLALVESKSRRSESALVGRVDGGTKVVFENSQVTSEGETRLLNSGDYVAVQIEDANSQTLRGRALRLTTLQNFEQTRRNQMLTKLAAV